MRSKHVAHRRPYGHEYRGVKIVSLVAPLGSRLVRVYECRELESGRPLSSGHYSLALAKSSVDCHCAKLS